MTHLYERWHGAADGRIRVAFGPLIPWGCSEATLQRTVALALSGASPRTSTPPRRVKKCR